MLRNKRFMFWQLLLVCLLVGVNAPSLPIAQAQTGQQSEEQIPGVPRGFTIVEGDIQIPIETARRLRQLKPNAPQVTLDTKFWPNGIIPFEFDNPTCSPVTAECVVLANQNAMFAAMAELESIANVRFQNCANNKCSGDYVHVQNSTGNNSAVGKVGGQQVINITSWGSKFIIVHELLHCLGLYHEQSRRDRDSFVTIKCANIQGDSGDCSSLLARANFNLLGNIATYRDYDFDSLMHYDRCAFSKDCPAGSSCNCTNETIEVKEPNKSVWQSRIGQHDHISALDKLAVMGIYPYPDWRFVDANSTDTGVPGFPQDSTFYGFLLRPFTSLPAAINATPRGGTLFVLPGTYFLSAPVSKAITLRAPLGGTEIRQQRGAAGETLATLSAASYNGELASQSIAALFGADLANSTAVATGLPLPTTLAGVTVKVKDSEGTERDAPLFFVSQFQINYQLPAGTKEGLASIAVFNNGKLAANGTVAVLNVAPAMFSANSSGQGVAAAFALRVRGNAQLSEPIARYDSQLQSFVPVPIDLGPESDQVFLILYGSGFQGVSNLASVKATIGGEPAEVLYAGPAPGFVGLDQANVRLPRSLAGKGEVSIVLTANNRSSNAVTISVR